MTELSGKVALVVGGSGGIGAASATELAAAGSDLALLGRDRAKLAVVAERLRARVRVATVPADLADDASLRSAILSAERELGRIDIVVLAGGGGPRGRIRDLTDAQWREAFEVKVLGFVRVVRAVLPALERAGGGAIVAVSGTGGREPKPEAIAVSVANAATGNLVKALADELAPLGIRVNAVSPGQVRTGRYAVRVDALALDRGIDAVAAERLIAEQIPLRRPGAPEEIGRIVRFLASDASSYVTGTTIMADGGWTRGAL